MERRKGIDYPKRQKEDQYDGPGWPSYLHRTQIKIRQPQNCHDQQRDEEHVQVMQVAAAPDLCADYQTDGKEADQCAQNGHLLNPVQVAAASEHPPAKEDP